MLVAALTRPAWADDGVLLESQRRVAGLVTMAKVVPILCPAIEADDDIIRALMEDAQITEQDVMRSDRFGIEDEAIARTFVQEIRADPTLCDAVLPYLGAREHLVRPKAGK